jgi:transcriptional regulator with XRE-family HTH domain
MLITGRELRAIRERLGISQAGMARLLGVNANAYAQQERGERAIRTTLARLAWLLVRISKDQRRAVLDVTGKGRGR